MKEQFKELNFRPASLARIEQLNVILDEYAAMGFRLTVRQLFYQMVARGLIPNTQRMYKNMVNLITNGRLAGMIDWNMIEDRVRQIIYPGHWKDPADIVRAAAQSFRVNRWEDQPNHIEIMIEKDALAGVLESVCSDLDVRLIPNRGYASSSTMYRHGWRMYDRKSQDGKELYVLYLGDFDPSGLDMDRDIVERLKLFSYYQQIHFERLALTMPQIEEHDPPPNPAKMSDSRVWKFIAEHGDQSWELDALPPNILRDLVETRIIELRDETIWDATMEVEDGYRSDLENFVEQWEAETA